MIEGYPNLLKDVHKTMAALGKEAPDTMAGFIQLHHAGTSDGVLSAKIKELIALAIGITVRCNSCIAYHVHDAVKAGATYDEVLDTIGVAIMMGGGPAVVYGAQALEALKQFEMED
jgi:AhpD family alkylhydroperoxidase